LIQRLPQNQQLFVKFWMPALSAGILAALLLLFIGDTPVTRASGLGLVVIGITATLRRMGAVIAFLGGLTLTLSPAFWSQTGGAEGDPATIVIAVGIALLIIVLMVLIRMHPYFSIAVGVTAFVVLFWSQIGTPRSVRLTSLVVAWLMYLMVDMLLLTNPRYDDEEQSPPPLLLNQSVKKNPKTDGYQAHVYHWGGILFLLLIGILNDPLLIMMIPATLLALYLSQTPLPRWYWFIFAGVVILGVHGIFSDYVANTAHFFVLDEWRHAYRWIDVLQYIIGQFSIVGVAMGILGLARLARWYPPLGSVTMVGYAAYTFFGLIYVGPRADLLLLPLSIIQIIWISYAIFTLGEWLSKTSQWRFGRYFIIGFYGLAPLYLLWQVLP
jgi:hypothetical protein